MLHKGWEIGLSEGRVRAEIVNLRICTVELQWYVESLGVAAQSRGRTWGHSLIARGVIIFPNTAEHGFKPRFASFYTGEKAGKISSGI